VGGVHRGARGGRVYGGASDVGGVMDAEMFPSAEFGVLLACLKRDLQTEDGLWTLRGFVDTARRVYSLTTDTKVISMRLTSRLPTGPSGEVRPQQRGYLALPLVLSQATSAIERTQKT